ncbi:hypothetical protein YC2023_117871 [Brassica napus]
MHESLSEVKNMLPKLTKAFRSVKSWELSSKRGTQSQRLLHRADKTLVLTASCKGR